MIENTSIIQPNLFEKIDWAGYIIPKLILAILIAIGLVLIIWLIAKIIQIDKNGNKGNN